MTALDAARTAGAAPIGRWLNFSVSKDEGGLLYRLGFDEAHIGNPAIRALHGGVIAAFLELSAQAALAASLNAGARLRTVTSSIDYLASSRAEDMAARVKILRTGRRIAFLEATGWQSDASRPVASGRFCLRIGTDKEK